jgi:hypothetical protein
MPDSKSEKIAAKLPHFYKSWDKNSLVFRFIDSAGVQLSDAERDLFNILKSHWVDTARSGDLDRIGRIYNLKRNPGESDSDYMARIKSSIQEFKGGGTINAIKTALRTALSLPDGYNIDIIENPKKEMSYNQKAKAGDESGTWKIKSFSVSDSKLTITLGVESSGDKEKTKIENPKLTNLETGESVLFNGSISEGKELVIKDGAGILNKIDVTHKLSIQKSPDNIMLPRKDSLWEYTETLKSSIGRFDFAKFDESVFEVGVPTANIGFKWTADLQSTFEVVLPKSILEERGFSREYVQNVVDRIKAIGVDGIVRLA